MACFNGNNKLFVLYYPYRSIPYQEMYNIFSTVKSALSDDVKLISIPDIVTLKQCGREELEYIKVIVEDLLKDSNK